MIGTQFKIRHYRPDPETGVPMLLWAQDGARGSVDFEGDGIYQGSAEDLAVIRNQIWTPNALVDEGELDILDVYFDVQAVRTSLFFRLYSDLGIVDTDTLALLTNETSGTGYAGITITRGTDWSAPALDGGDGQTTTVTKTFSAGGTWTNADELILATVASGTAGLFLGFAALSTTRQLENADTLDVTLAVKLA